METKTKIPVRKTSIQMRKLEEITATEEVIEVIVEEEAMPTSSTCLATSTVPTPVLREKTTWWFP